MVRPGTYQDGLVINKEVEIIGDGLRDNIIVESTESNCILMETDKTLVKGLTLRGKVGTNDNKYFAVNIPQGELILEDCDITSDSLSCITIHGETANPTIRNCQIHDGKGTGVYVYNKSQGTLENCDIFANAVSGIEIKEEGNPTIRNCQIHYNRKCEIYVYNKGKGIIENCDIISYLPLAIEIQKGCNTKVIKCKINDPSSSYAHITNLTLIFLVILLVILLVMSS